MVYVREGLLEKVLCQLRLECRPTLTSNLSSVLRSANIFHGKLERLKLRFLQNVIFMFSFFL